MKVEYVTISTGDLAAAAAFFAKTIGTEMVDCQTAARGHASCMLQLNGQPLLQLVQKGLTAGRRTAVIEHVGICLENFAEFTLRLQTLGIDYSILDLRKHNQKRVLLRVPGGPMLEAVFHSSQG